MSFWLAFAGFIAVLVVAVALENEVRIVGREKLGSLPVSAWLGAGHRPRQQRQVEDDD